MSERVRFDINIPADEIIAYYKGIARQVSVEAYDGRRIEFPAEKLRPFLNHSGVYGIFELEFDDQHRFVALHRLK
ncbi:MAG: DUF2835 domain-containing protein [Gammaproteobacteria bacterium]|nr:DUF2835 domain-containing protein [Gammaproteobacteria bacterium]